MVPRSSLAVAVAVASDGNKNFFTAAVSAEDLFAVARRAAQRSAAQASFGNGIRSIDAPLRRIGWKEGRKPPKKKKKRKKSIVVCSAIFLLLYY